MDKEISEANLGHVNPQSEQEKKNELWKEIKAQMAASLAGLPPDIIQKKLRIAYNRLFGITNTVADIRAASVGDKLLGELESYTVGDENF